MLKVVDLFSGCGGLSLGFSNAGFNIVCAIDKWDKAIEVYRDNMHDHEAFVIDLFSQQATDLISSYTPDIIIGGPPCQDFSSAGLRNETLGRADLTVRFAEIVKNILPKYFVMENVDRITKSSKLTEVKEMLREMGYGLSAITLDASYCNVPQKRKRFFLIGELNGTEGFLNHLLEQNLTKEPLTVKKYFGDRLNISSYYRHPRSYQRRGIFSTEEPSPTIRGVNRPIPKGYVLHPGDTVLDTNELRPLTYNERAEIQTFPSDFVFKGTKSEIEQMIGNAVPVKLAEYVACALKCHINKDSYKVMADGQGLFAFYEP